MSDGVGAPLEHAAASLRREFDASFAEPPRGALAPPERLLALRVRGEAYALRLGDIAGLSKDRRVTPLPSPLPGLLGIAGVRGTIVPVFDLGSLLGLRPADETPRWLVLVAPRDPLGLAFAAFEGLLTARPEETAWRARPILDVPALIEAVMARSRNGPARSEDR